MRTLRAGLYACPPEALSEIVERAADRLASIIDNPAYVVDRDRLAAYLAEVGIEVGEVRHAKQAEVDLAKKKLRDANAEIERLRFELARAKRSAA